MKSVGIIGGAGFIGSYITKVFLEENYKVKVSTTDLENRKKYEHLFRFDSASNLEVAPLKLFDKKSIKNFIQGCNVIVHAGTPFKLDITDPEEELFLPTVMGTRNILTAARKEKALTKIVFVASVATWNTAFPFNPLNYSPNYIFSEKDTPYFSEKDHPYAQSKFLANNEVNVFMQKNSDLPFEIVSVSPVMVIGNSLSTRNDSTSMVMQHQIKNKIASNPFVEMLFRMDTTFAMVDVRDVAEAVFIAANTPGIHGKNYLIANESYPVSDISLMLNKAEPLNKPAITYNSSLAKNDLGIAFISAKDSLHHCI